MAIENAIIVINKTRLEQLVERFNTKAQARFYIEHAGGLFSDYELEHETFRRSLERVQQVVSSRLKYKIVERKYVPNFLFSENDLVIVLGQDGLVANTAKYVNGLPILAVNPDPKRFDGILLPYDTATFEKGLLGSIENRVSFKFVTMAEAQMNDGQKLLAFNDLFIGPSSHVSARYRITFNQISENHSSSGIIVSTGAGSTGWMSSLINMANGIASTFRHEDEMLQMQLKWEEQKLVFIVREPFQSRHSQISVTAGMITQSMKLRIESFMPSNGVIFSDGIEADYLAFNSGSIVEIGIAKQQARIVNS